MLRTVRSLATIARRDAGGKGLGLGERLGLPQSDGAFGNGRKLAPLPRPTGVEPLRALFGITKSDRGNYDTAWGT